MSSNTIGRPGGGSSAPMRPAKSPTGIVGFDEITGGGLPKGRSTLVTGSAGSGKTLFGLEWLARGAQEFGEPGVLVTFEESADELAENVASLGFDLPALEAACWLVVEAIRVDHSQIVKAGAFDLDGLFIRLAGAVDSIGAKRVVLDTSEVLYGALGDEAIVRAEMTRLFRWCKDQGLTLLVTGEKGRDGMLTRYGIEEYVSDCVIALDHRVTDSLSTRRMRVLKYRGSSHGTNEYPFLITERGFQVLPATSMGLSYTASSERMPMGVPSLDQMLGGGVYRGSTVLISGSAGTGKTTLAAHAVDAACSRGERALLISLEESPDQLLRNMSSVGIDLRRWVDAGLLTVWAERSTAHELESHLGAVARLLDECAPQVVAIDALGSLMQIGREREVTSTIAREIDLIKDRSITGVITSLTPDTGESEDSSLGVSSLVDTWLRLRNVESDGERNRLLYVIKSRGTAHSNQVREFLLTNNGADLLDVVVGPEGVLTGSARDAHLALEQAQIAALRAQLEAEALGLEEQLAAESRVNADASTSQAALSRNRTDATSGSPR